MIFFFAAKTKVMIPAVSDTMPLLIFCQVARVTKSRNNHGKKERHEELGPKSDCFHGVL